MEICKCKKVMKNAKEYGQYEFQQACQDMGIIKDLDK